jgi:hypothetical protein
VAWCRTYLPQHHFSTFLHAQYKEHLWLASVEGTFVYTGLPCGVPRDVISVQFHPSIVGVTGKTF